MKTIAVKDEQHILSGGLEGLLAGSPRIGMPEYAKATSRMADLSRRKSRSVKIGLGLDILGSFLSGLGVAMAPGIRTEFEKAEEVDFSFGDVSRTWVDNNWLGRALVGKMIDSRNPSARIYLDEPDPWQLLLIDSVITSKSFTIGITKHKKETATLDVGAIQDLLGSGNVTIAASSGESKELTFSGTESLTFAFTAVRLHLSRDGAILAAPPGADALVLSATGNSQIPSYGLDHIELSDGPAMVELK
ncbi:hypothetical protein [Streptomyces sp. NPDC090057]|uniref:gasdermin n=1 Tax=Streptomyces sp. NPDC090057 TaxID=3365935 RepID=UPI0037F46F0B